MAIAVCGLAIICLSGANQHVHPFGIILMLISVFVYSFSIFWVKKVNAQIQPMAQATGSILVSSILLVVLFHLFGNMHRHICQKPNHYLP